MKVSLDRCEKQVEIWKLIGNSEQLSEISKCKEKNRRFHARVLIKRVEVKPLYPQSKKREYNDLKWNIIKIVQRREGFVNLDRSLIDKTARLYADWLLCEELMGNETDPDNLRKYANALSNIDVMLLESMRELHITPTLRKKLAAELMSDDEITKKLKAIMSAPLNMTTQTTQSTQMEQEKKVEP